MSAATSFFSPDNDFRMGSVNDLSVDEEELAKLQPRVRKTAAVLPGYVRQLDNSTCTEYYANKSKNCPIFIPIRHAI